ncbi:hypothetical protein GCM10025883_31350 [Mobilicoccus caccae]|uniref:Uncharacterized protein n=1 Tax=Mobilicoccus caccae TaxID=1859295 RepID=A0ABQ6IT38_9MICO|nr:hypothetical protein GCM10025883_31350 [Mobilicoccus caccae]
MQLGGEDGLRRQGRLDVELTPDDAFEQMIDGLLYQPLACHEVLLVGRPDAHPGYELEAIRHGPSAPMTRRKTSNRLSSEAVRGGSRVVQRRRRRAVPKMLRVISRPMAVPALRSIERIIGFSMTCSSMPGS